jgi:hypothetical protein
MAINIWLIPSGMRTRLILFFVCSPSFSKADLRQARSHIPFQKRLYSNDELSSRLVQVAIGLTPSLMCVGISHLIHSIQIVGQARVPRRYRRRFLPGLPRACSRCRSSSTLKKPLRENEIPENVKNCI